MEYDSPDRNHHDEIQQGIEHSHDPPKISGPMKVILSVGLALLIVLMVIPAYNITMNPPPKNIPSLADVVPADLPTSVQAPAINGREDYVSRIMPHDPIVKRVADRIATQSCPSAAKTCQARAMFYFVRDNFDYVSDPISFEYVKTPIESLASAGGDCDDASVLLSSLLRAIGVPTRLVFIPGHVYVQARILDAPRRYKDDFGWIDMDPTCGSCEFGEIPYTTADARKIFVD